MPTKSLAAGATQARPEVSLRELAQLSELQLPHEDLQRQLTGPGGWAWG